MENKIIKCHMIQWVIYHVIGNVWLWGKSTLNGGFSSLVVGLQAMQWDVPIVNAITVSNTT